MSIAIETKLREAIDNCLIFYKYDKFLIDIHLIDKSY